MLAKYATWGNQYLISSTIRGDRFVPGVCLGKQNSKMLFMIVNLLGQNITVEVGLKELIKPLE